MAARPLSIADELAIRSMFARYVHLLDGGDAEGRANLFTEDGRWTRLNSPPRELAPSANSRWLASTSCKSRARRKAGASSRSTATSYRKRIERRIRKTQPARWPRAGLR